MKLILANTSKCKKIQIDDSKKLNHLIHMENKIVEFLKRLKKNKKFLIKSTMNYTLQVQNQVLYTVFVKFTKVLLIGVPPFCPILSAIGTPTYELVKCPLPLLEPLTYN